MNSELTQVPTPEWMLSLFEAIDTLDTSESSGFQIFADDVVMQFGPQTARGIEAVKQFFLTLDGPFITKHVVHKVFQFDRAFMMQGGATLRKNGEPKKASFSAAPLFNLFWFNETGLVSRYGVDFPPDLAKQSGLAG